MREYRVGSVLNDVNAVLVPGCSDTCSSQVDADDPTENVTREHNATKIDNTDLIVRAVLELILTNARSK